VVRSRVTGKRTFCCCCCCCRHLSDGINDSDVTVHRLDHIHPPAALRRTFFTQSPTCSGLAASTLCLPHRSSTRHCSCHRCSPLSSEPCVRQPCLAQSTSTRRKHDRLRGRDIFELLVDVIQERLVMGTYSFMYRKPPAVHICAKY